MALYSMEKKHLVNDIHNLYDKKVCASFTENVT